MNAIKAAWKWAVAIGGACIVLLLAILGYGRRKAQEGLAIGQIDEERDRLHEAAERGDDAAVEEEWRRSRK